MWHAFLLAVAGVASGVLASWPPLGGQASSIAAVSLGGVLAAYLWLHAGVRSPARLAGMILAAIVGHYVMVFIGLASVLLMYVLASHANLSPSLAMAPAAAVGTTVIAVVFLQALPSTRDQLGLEITCCAIAGGLLGCLWEFAGFSAVRWLAPLPVLNGALAAVFGLVAYLRSRPVAASTMSLRLLAGAGLAGVCAVFVFGNSLRAAAVPAPVRIESPYVGAVRAATLKSVSEAPSSTDLAAIPVVPARDMFTPRPIAGFTCYPPNDDPLAPDTREVESQELRTPARHRYHLQCYPKNEGTQSLSDVHVWVVQYPNDAWARYDLRNQDGYQGLIQDRHAVTRITKHGRPLFVGKTGTYWSSGDKVLDISGSAPPETLDAFIDAYLTRYPNTLEPGFDLPYLPSR
jgi:hypothetical protein